MTTVTRPRFSLRVHVKSGEAGLNRDTWAKCDQVTTLKKALLLYPLLGRGAEETLQSNEQGVKLALQLL